MTLFIAAAIALGAIGPSWLLTALVGRIAPRARLLDISNERISHTVSTPRGGRVGIVVSFLAIIAAVGQLGLIEQRLMVAALGGRALA